MMQSLIVVSCLLLALSTQGAPLASNKSNGTMTKRSHGWQTMIVDSDVHNNVMNSRQATEEVNKRSHTRNNMIVDNMDFETMMNSRQATEDPSDSEAPRDRRAFFINGGTTYDNTVNIRPSQTAGQAMSQQSSPSKGFYINGAPLVVNGADGSRTLNPAFSSGDPAPIPNSAPLTNDSPMYPRESVDDGNTTESPSVAGPRDFRFDHDEIFKNQMNSRRSNDDGITTETPAVVGSRDFLIMDSNVYKNQMNSRRSIDERDTTETPAVAGPRDFRFDHDEIFKNQMNSRRNIDDDDTTETPVLGSRAFAIGNDLCKLGLATDCDHVRRSIDDDITTETPVKLGSRNFQIDNSNVYKNQMNSRRSVDDRDTTETPVVTGSRDFHFSNNNMFDNKNTTHTKLDTPPLPKDAPK